jgi:hypothetical protein
MQTDRWIEMLASQAEPVAARRAGPLMTRLLPWGLAGSLLVMLSAYGLRHDFPEVARLPMFWLKVGAPLAITLAGIALVGRLGRPGVRAGHAWWGVALPVLVLWLAGAWQWLAASPLERPPLLWGQTWRSCVVSIGLIALPVFVAALAVLRQLAPTRPTRAGAAAGTLAGSAGACVYAFHCPELTAPFLAVWYVLGMALPTLAGAALGARLLRW